MKKIFLLTLITGVLSCNTINHTEVIVTPKTINRIDNNMHDMPQDYKLKDFRAIAIMQDQLFFDSDATGKYLPVIEYDNSQVNFPMLGFTLPSYIGSRGRGEALSSIGAVVGASLVGIDKSNQNGKDYVRMLKQYYNTANGEGLVLNNFSARTGGTFWYEIFPSVGFIKLVDLYPSMNDMSDIMRNVADRWLIAIDKLLNDAGYPDFDYTSFSFSKGEGIDNKRWKEADAAAGVAWIEFMAYRKFGDEKYLQAAKRCMEFLENRPLDEGPYYEILMPYGALLAARLNAEMDYQYDVDKMIRFSIDGRNSSRKGWGMILSEIGGISMNGLVGQQSELYAFAMNTFDQLSTMLPIAKYDPGYARSIGKWALNCISASRLFYQDEHPANRQTCYNEFLPEKFNPVCYEGVRGTLDGGRFDQYKTTLAPVGPYAVGDYKKNPRNTEGLDFCPYGSAWIGELAAIFKPTNVEGILQLDCSITDFFNKDKYPTYLYYNPYNKAKKISINVGNNGYDLYDTIVSGFVRKNVKGVTTIKIPAKGVSVIVLLPAGGKITQSDKQKLMNGIVFDYGNI